MLISPKKNYIGLLSSPLSKLSISALWQHFLLVKNISKQLAYWLWPCYWVRPSLALFVSDIGIKPQKWYYTLKHFYIVSMVYERVGGRRKECCIFHTKCPNAPFLSLSLETLYHGHHIYFAVGVELFIILVELSSFNL